MNLVEELVLLKQEFEKRSSEIDSQSALADIELGIVSFCRIITVIENLSLNDSHHQSQSLNEVQPLDAVVTKSEHTGDSSASGAVAEEFNKDQIEYLRYCFTAWHNGIKPDERDKELERKYKDKLEKLATASL